MKKLFIVRHGEIDFNTAGRYAGSVDVELNEKGLRQARDMANEVSKLKIDFIISYVGKMIHKFFHVMTEEQFFEYKLDNAKVVEYDFVK